MNDNGVEMTNDGPKTASIFFGRSAATGMDLINGVRKMKLAAVAIATAILPPFVTDHPGANGNKAKSANP